MNILAVTVLCQLTCLATPCYNLLTLPTGGPTNSRFWSKFAGGSHCYADCPECTMAGYFFQRFLLRRDGRWKNVLLPWSKTRGARKKAIELLWQAREQYVTCRGVNSALVERVDKRLAELVILGENKAGDSTTDVEEDDDSDLILGSGGVSRVLFEIKTYEPDAHLEDLAIKIKAMYGQEVMWADGFRIYDMGYGIQTLILSFEMDESIKLKEDFAEEMEGAFEDETQHVDIILTAQDYY